MSDTPKNLAPPRVQRELVAEVSAQASAIQQVKDSLVRQFKLLDERKRALITAAVTGRIDVTTARGVDVS